jgi:hypothetical protein
VERYGDLITTGLDLVSFLLLTPEILRVIAPTAIRLINGLIAALLVGVVAALPMFSPLLLSNWLGWELTAWMIIERFL